MDQPEKTVHRGANANQQAGMPAEGHGAAEGADPEQVAAAMEQARASSEAASAAAESGARFNNVPVEDDGMPAPEALKQALRAVVDPEIGYNIVDLGLVYEVTKPEPGKAHVLMTLTSMGCPLTEIIHQQCSVILGTMPGVEDVEVEFTFSPPWDTSMIEEYVAEELRAMGMNV